MKVMGTVMMETTMLAVTMMEVIAALVLIHHLTGISTALFVNVNMVVHYQMMPMMSTAMMKTTMLVVTMMEAIAALVMIHHLDGILTALFVNVLKAKVFWAYRISHVNLHDKQIIFSEISFIK